MTVLAGNATGFASALGYQLSFIGRVCENVLRAHTVNPLFQSMSIGKCPRSGNAGSNLREGTLRFISFESIKLVSTTLIASTAPSRFLCACFFKVNPDTKEVLLAPDDSPWNVEVRTQSVRQAGASNTSDPSRPAASSASERSAMEEQIDAVFEIKNAMKGLLDLGPFTGGAAGRQ